MIDFLPRSALDRAMTTRFTDMVEEARLSLRAIADYGEHLFNPTLRLGVTGLARAGKTVFITSLIHGLLRGGRFPVFDAYATGRIARAHLAPQPDDAVPRFDYENHLRSLIDARQWPQSTTDISELRLVIEYQRANGTERTLTLDIVDYPGEWLLDLPLLNKSYEQWSAESLMLSRNGPRVELAKDWHAHLATLDPDANANEQDVRTAAGLFTAYLRACRDERFAMSLLPPGRFLMPGNLAGSPALTFAPLDLSPDIAAPEGSLHAMMRRRYEAYKDIVVRPFFRDHFARLDRQIVLVDALTAFNAGPEALGDLQAALEGILDCYQVGRNNWLSTLLRPRIDKILFAATKADHLHHTSHDQLEAILKRMVERAVTRAKFTGTSINVVALAAIRATREARVERGREHLPSIVGTPAQGEIANGESFDGTTEVATFPGDLPTRIDDLFPTNDALQQMHRFQGLSHGDADHADYRFLRFRPPQLDNIGAGDPPLPHIRLDRALQFLIGDRLQ
jgi:predicted YcjX-like family ATPase